MTSQNEEQKKDAEKALRRYKEKIISKIDAEQVKTESLDESKVVPEAEDLEPSEFTSGSDAMADGNESANPETDKSTRSRRFSIEHEEIVDKDSLLLKQIKKKTDTPADKEKSE